MKTHGDEPLSRVPDLQNQQLLSSLHTFSLWLSSPGVFHSSRLSQLTNQRLHTQIHQTALKKLAQTYELLCDEVRKPENKYEAASTLLGSERPFGQVGMLYQILGIDESSST